MKKLQFIIIRVLTLSALCVTGAFANTVSFDTTFNGTGYSIHPAIPAPGYSVGGSMARQADGKIVLAGYTVVSQTELGPVVVMRLNVDGTLDNTFGSGGFVSTNNVQEADFVKVLVQPDGKILWGGTGSTEAGALDFMIIRYNTDGSLDTSFNSTGIMKQTLNGFSIEYLKDMILQPDGKIVAVGKTFAPPQTALPYDLGVARFNPNGSLDTSFNGTGIRIVGTANVDESGEAVTLQPDGKILVGGLRSPAQGVGNFLLMRLNADGTTDTSFGTGGTTITIAGSQFHLISTMALQSDGKIVAGGGEYLARYTTGGILDTSFGINGVINAGGANAIKIIGGDKILTANSIGATPSRYLKDGARDTNFGGGASVPNQICSNRSIELLSDGKILMGGTCYNNSDQISKFAAMRLQETRTSPQRFLDFDGDGRTDMSVFRPSNGQWWLLGSSISSTTVAAFGTATDRLAPADFTGDGRTDIAIFRPGTGEWFILRSYSGTFYSVPFGTSGDVPVPGDYDGDQIDDIAVFRPSTNEWFIQKSTGGVIITTFGSAGDKPVPSDYDGDFKTDIAIYRPSAGEWWVQKSSDAGVYAFQFGTSSDKPVPGDYTGDNKTDAAFWRPSTGEWFILRSEDYSYYSIPFGLSDDLPTPGNYSGDGRFDLVVFRPSTNTWHVQITGGTYFNRVFGASGDQPVPNVFVP